MGGAPLFEILFLGLRRPAVESVTLRLRAYVLGSECHRVADEGHGAFASVEGHGFAGGVVLVAMQMHGYAGVIVEGGEQVRIIAAILEVGETAAGVSALGRGIDAGDA